MDHSKELLTKNEELETNPQKAVAERSATINITDACDKATLVRNPILEELRRSLSAVQQAEADASTKIPTEEELSQAVDKEFETLLAWAKVRAARGETSETAYCFDRITFPGGKEKIIESKKSVMVRDRLLEKLTGMGFTAKECGFHSVELSW